LGVFFSFPLGRIELRISSIDVLFYIDDFREGVMNIEWDYSYYQPWSDNEWLVDKMLAIQEEMLISQNKDITMQ